MASLLTALGVFAGVALFHDTMSSQAIVAQESRRSGSVFVTPRRPEVASGDTGGPFRFPWYGSSGYEALRSDTRSESQSELAAAELPRHRLMQDRSAVEGTEARVAWLGWMNGHSSLRQGGIREFRASNCYLVSVIQNPANVLLLFSLPICWEFKGLRFLEFRQDLTEADRLNGVRSSSYVIAKCDAVRFRVLEFDPEASREDAIEMSDWTKWVDETDAFPLFASVMEASGVNIEDILTKTSEGTAIAMVHDGQWKVRTAQGEEIDFPGGLFGVSGDCSSLAVWRDDR